MEQYGRRTNYIPNGVDPMPKRRPNLIRKKFGLEKEYDSSTVSGWVMEELGKVPEIGDTFSYGNLSVVVTKAEFRRAIEIQITVSDPEDSPQTT